MNIANDTCKKWTAYNTWNDKGPYLVLIIDCEWWDKNRDTIDEWFDYNCPDCKPEPCDTIITFDDRSKYILWNMCWNQV